MRRIARRMAAFATSRTPAAASRSSSPSALRHGLERRPGSRRVHADRLAEERVAAERARDGVGVGDGGRRPAQPVAGGSGARARALRPDPERAALGAGQRARRRRRSTRRRPRAGGRGGRPAAAGAGSPRARRRSGRHPWSCRPCRRRWRSGARPPARGTARRRRRPPAPTPPWRAGAGARPPPTSCRRSTGGGGASRRRPARASEASRSARYRSAIGITAAFSAVVAVRSYSRNSALISCETETNGTCPSSAARSRASWAGCA